MAAKQRFTVVATTLSAEHSKDKQDHVDMRLVPEMPNSGPSLENVLSDLKAFTEACNQVAKAGRLVGVAPVGDPPQDKEIDLPIKSSDGELYAIGIDAETLRSRIWTAINSAHQLSMRQSLVSKYAPAKTAAAKGRRAKGFIV